MPTLDEIAKGPTNIKDWFSSLSEHVAESRRVIEELSKEDPPTEPFRSKYAGRNMLKSALERTQNFNPSTDTETSRVRLAQATVYYYLGLERNILSTTSNSLYDLCHVLSNKCI